MTRDPLLPLDRASVFFDGIFSEPRLAHPECVAIAPDGAVWCGSESGAIHRVAPDGSAIETVASTGGFILGIAFDAAGRLYCCDLRHAAVFRLDTAQGTLERLDGSAPIGAPNLPVVDEARGVLYVSDSHAAGEPGVGVWRLDLATGECSPWWPEPLVFANGMVLDRGGDALLVVESFARRVVRFPIGADGSAGAPTVVAEGIARVPDGLTQGPDGTLYVSCYEPSQIYRITPGGQPELLIDDPEAHLLCHPTNSALRGEELIVANLGRWHLTRVALGT